MKERFAKLIDVKSIITFGIIGVLLVLSARERIPSDKLYDLALVVVSFYFGTKRGEDKK